MTDPVSRHFDLGAHVSGVGFLGAQAAFALGSGQVLFAGIDGTSPAGPRAHDGACLTAFATREALFTGGDDGRVMRVGVDGKPVELARFPGRWIEAIAVAKTGVAAAVGKDMQLIAGGTTRKVGPHPSTITDLSFSPDGSRLAAAHYGGVSIWNLAKPDDRPRALNWKGSHLKLSYAPNAKYLATTTQENAIHVWRLTNGEDMQMAGYPAKIKSLGWTHDSQFLVSAGADSFVCWPFAGAGPEGKPPIEIAGAEGRAVMTVIAIHRDAPFAVAGFDDGELMLADLEQQRAVPLKSAGGGAVTALAWSWDGWRFAYGCESGAAGLFELRGNR